MCLFIVFNVLLPTKTLGLIHYERVKMRLHTLIDNHDLFSQFISYIRLYLLIYYLKYSIVNLGFKAWEACVL